MDHVILWMMPLPCLLSFRTTSQNCKWRSRSSSNNLWSNLGRYIFKPKHCIRQLIRSSLFWFLVAVRKCPTFHFPGWWYWPVNHFLDHYRWTSFIKFIAHSKIVCHLGGSLSNSSAHFCRTFSAFSVFHYCLSIHFCWLNYSHRYLKDKSWVRIWNNNNNK